MQITAFAPIGGAQPYTPMQWNFGHTQEMVIARSSTNMSAAAAIRPADCSRRHAIVARNT